ncbi:hypothetical protein B5F76_07720 [Desulfovibrio sp. An276]|uniref:hypothetical protein n=1 Tax=Desulfovibrio sp. An276 TaxID=1965618 RepID=UPI000B388291|nr:hypothetical protein [Desulfovibrio sp. An276]OUO52305.1 hypothetical protein B5F76_07720 [Desulfovibrio sp. An276]
MITIVKAPNRFFVILGSDKLFIGSGTDIRLAIPDLADTIYDNYCFSCLDVLNNISGKKLSDEGTIKILLNTYDVVSAFTDDRYLNFNITTGTDLLEYEAVDTQNNDWYDQMLSIQKRCPESYVSEVTIGMDLADVNYSIECGYCGGENETPVVAIKDIDDTIIQSVGDSHRKLKSRLSIEIAEYMASKLFTMTGEKILTV